MIVDGSGLVAGECNEALQRFGSDTPVLEVDMLASEALCIGAPQHSGADGPERQAHRRTRSA